LAGIPAVAGNSAVDGVLLMLTSLLFREFPPLSASLLLLASLLWGVSLLFLASPAIAGNSAVDGVLLMLTSLLFPGVSTVVDVPAVVGFCCSWHPFVIRKYFLLNFVFA
jgi:hypothetical protein